MEAINDFEKLLTWHNDTKILKFYLHISPQEQHKRLEERIKDPAKQWKYNKSDFEEAKYWNDYMKVYEDCFAYCDHIPWTIVPSDQNWYKEYVIASAVKIALKKFDMKFPGLKK
jgi:polyphosphate kinase 2 (PPK2 family)